MAATVIADWLSRKMVIGGFLPMKSSIRARKPSKRGNDNAAAVNSASPVESALVV